MDTPHRAGLSAHPPGGVVYIHTYMASCQVASTNYDACVNKYGVKCGDTLEKWEKSGMGGN